MTHYRDNNNSAVIIAFMFCASLIFIGGLLTGFMIWGM